MNEVNTRKYFLNRSVRKKELKYWQKELIFTLKIKPTYLINDEESDSLKRVKEWADKIIYIKNKIKEIYE